MLFVVMLAGSVVVILLGSLIVILAGWVVVIFLGSVANADCTLIAVVGIVMDSANAITLAKTTNCLYVFNILE